MALFKRRIRPSDFATDPAVVGPATSVSDEHCSPAVGTNWMQMPTVREAGGQMPLRGTSFHQDVIAPLAWAAREGVPATDLLTVQLAVVPSGQRTGAVGVYAAGKRVASIPAETPRSSRP